MAKVDSRLCREREREREKREREVREQYSTRPRCSGNNFAYFENTLGNLYGNGTHTSSTGCNEQHFILVKFIFIP